MEQIRNETINWDVVTVGDLLDKFELKGETVDINNGKIGEEA